jgi:hypothetical protein
MKAQELRYGRAKLAPPLTSLQRGESGHRFHKAARERGDRAYFAATHLARFWQMLQKDFWVRSREYFSGFSVNRGILIHESGCLDSIVAAFLPIVWVSGDFCNSICQ